MCYLVLQWETQEGAGLVGGIYQQEHKESGYYLFSVMACVGVCCDEGVCRDEGVCCDVGVCRDEGVCRDVGVFAMDIQSPCVPAGRTCPVLSC